MGSEQLLDNGKALFSALLDDMAVAQERLNKDDTQYERRAYDSTLFATIEGIVFAIKQELLEGWHKLPVRMRRLRYAAKRPIP